MLIVAEAYILHLNNVLKASMHVDPRSMRSRLSRSCVSDSGRFWTCEWVADWVAKGSVHHVIHDTTIHTHYTLPTFEATAATEAQGNMEKRANTLQMVN